MKRHVTQCNCMGMCSGSGFTDITVNTHKPLLVLASLIFALVTSPIHPGPNTPTTPT